MSAHRQVPAHFKEEPVANMGTVRFTNARGARMGQGDKGDKGSRGEWANPTCITPYSGQARMCAEPARLLLSGRSEAHTGTDTETGLDWGASGTTKCQTSITGGCEAGGPHTTHHTPNKQQANLVNGTPRLWVEGAGGVISEDYSAPRRTLNSAEERFSEATCGRWQPATDGGAWRSVQRAIQSGEPGGAVPPSGGG
ncbi:hypothetical protein AK830_g7381 [Neonectria ditissima]|uniref:Uncharacterized protein n=1 Tax=Neonectria ditissima TaxID=78410 RepID=A0A0P7AN01_9HYPO|nr:hypothetical protein AK830_g7381 [Neonectria ditissima]